MTPHRIRWAIEQLAIDGNDRLLEIGCGRGIAASLVCSKLTSGRLTAIDRSAKAIDAARLGNAACEATGKVVFIQGALAEFNAGGALFDKVFAINVNLFWIDAQRELSVVRRVLAPGGCLSLFYEPPSAGRGNEAATRCMANLQSNGFAVERIERDVVAPNLFAIIARPIIGSPSHKKL
jgi:SAM-dependent methyltransferase